MKPVTDPNILKQLNSSQPQPVTDPDLISKLDGSDFDFSATETIKNVPGSALNAGKQMLEGLTSLDTYKAVGGGVKQLLTNPNSYPGGSLITKGLGINKDFNAEEKKFVKGIKDYAIDKYGTIDRAQETFQNDPVGSLLDAGTVVAPATGLLPKASKAAGAAKIATNPVDASIRGTKGLLGSMIPERLPQTMYERAAKFSTSLTPEQKIILSKTALKEGIPLTPKGFDKLNNKLSGLGGQIDGLISEAEKAGTKIPVGKVFKEIVPLRDQLSSLSNLEGGKNFKAVSKVATQYAKRLNERKIKEFTPKQLQDFKTNLYRDINFASKRNKSKLPKKEAQKAFAKGAASELETAMPGIGEINKRYGPLAELRDNIQQPISRIANNNAIGLDTLGKAGLGELAMPGAGTAGAALGLLTKDGMVSRSAIMLENLRKRGLLDQGKISPEVYLGLYQAGQDPQ